MSGTGKATGEAPALVALGVGANVARSSSAESALPPTPEAEAEAEATVVALVSKQTFTLYIRGAMRTFDAGSVIDDPLLMADVLAARAPVEQVTDAEDMLQCPHCRRFFTVALAVAQED